MKHLHRPLVLLAAGAACAALAGCGGGSGSSGSSGTTPAPSPSSSMSSMPGMSGSSMPGMSSSSHSAMSGMSSGSGSGAKAMKAAVGIKDFAYQVPSSVKPGATITVTNSDSQAHTVTADKAGGFDVKVGGNGTATFTAPTKPGKYPFHCVYHSNMHGTLVVS